MFAQSAQILPVPAVCSLKKISRTRGHVLPAATVRVSKNVRCLVLPCLACKSSGRRAAGNRLFIIETRERTRSMSDFRCKKTGGG